jgi:hypothetical protein
MKRIVPTVLWLFAAATAQADGVLTEFPRTPAGRPDLSGVWQALNTAHWNLEPHVSDYPVLLELGAQFAVPPGQGVVEGGPIPYMPYPFQIFQSEDDVVISYQFATGFRRIFVNGEAPAPLDSWMGWSNAHWEGDTFVVEVTGLNGLTWLDRAGNYASANATVVERYTPLGPNHLEYEATIEDPTVFSRPWTIRMPLYRIVDENFRLLEFKCEPFAEEKIYGHLRKPGAESPEGVANQ